MYVQLKTGSDEQVLGFFRYPLHPPLIQTRGNQFLGLQSELRKGLSLVDRETWWFIHYQLARVTVDSLTIVQERVYAAESKMNKANFQCQDLQKRLNAMAKMTSLSKTLDSQLRVAQAAANDSVMEYGNSTLLYTKVDR